MFKSLYNLIVNILRSNNNNWFAQIFAGSAVGIATISGLDIFVDYYKSRALAEFGNLGSVSGLLGLAGLDKAVSIIIGAYIASVYIKTFAVGLRMIKK